MSDIQDSVEDKKRDYLRARNSYAQALRVRSESEKLNPEMFKKFSKPSPLDRVREARISGMEIRSFEDGLGDEKAEKTHTTTSPNLRADIIKAIIASGRSAEESEKLMERLAPHLLAVENPAAALLVSRLGNGEKLGFKEMLEVLNMRNSQSQSDPASMATAIVNAIKTGAELSKANNNGVDAMQLMQMQQQSHDRLVQMQEKHFAEIQDIRGSQPRLSDSLAEIQTVSEQLGWKNKPETENVTLKRLELDQRKWEKQSELDAETRKAQSQTQLVKTITDRLGAVLESPIIAQAGKSIGEAIGKKSPTLGAAIKNVANAPETVARQELTTPVTDQPSKFTCARCQFQRLFTKMELALIEEKGGRYICQNCGDAYQLKGTGEPGSGADRS